MAAPPSESARDANHGVAGENLSRHSAEASTPMDNKRDEEANSLHNVSSGSNKGGVYDRVTKENAPDGNDSDSSDHHDIGVSRVEAFNKVLYESGRSGKTLLWLLAISILLTMFAYALDLGLTTYVFNVMASSTFGKHSQLGTVSTVSQIIRAISKPFIGKLADITSRPTTYVIVLCFYVVGFIVGATSSTFPAYVVGICFTAVGKSGLDLLSDIIVGDLTPLQWRGFFGSFLSVPFIVTSPINGFITEAFAYRWRWGLGMFAIIMPVLLLPAIITLYAMQRRGEKLGMVTMASSKRVRTGVADEAEEGSKGKTFSYWLGMFREGLIDIDIFGLIILGFAFSLILLPFSLAKSATGGWSNPSMIAMIVIGFVLVFVFILFEKFVSPRPIMSKHIIQNRTFLAAAFIYAFNQMSSSVRNTYFSSYVYIIKQWTEFEWIIFLSTTTMGLSLLGPIVGLIQARTHRYKSLMVFGAVCKIIGYGILIMPNGFMTQDTTRLVASQLIYCLASFNVVGVRVGSQASVPHKDMASVISLLTLWSTLGSATGSAIAGAVWTNEMLDRMKSELPDVQQKTIKKIYGSIKDLRLDYDFNDPIRQGSIRAYSWVNGHICIVAVILSCVPLIATFFMPDYYLGKQQNAVTNTGLDGSKVEVPEHEAEKNRATDGPKPFLHKLRDAYRRT